jgi:hypothetical protein
LSGLREPEAVPAGPRPPATFAFAQRRKTDFKPPRPFAPGFRARLSRPAFAPGFRARRRPVD